MSVRVIARLDVKSENLIKGIRFEGLKRIGDPAEAAARYFVEGADEVYLVDTVASLYGRNHMGPLLEKVAKKVFVPLTASGGIRTVHDAELLFGFGADKVGLRTKSLFLGLRKNMGLSL
jgi:cyclase